MTAAAQISGVGISQVASGFLSLSSILRPLSARLSNTAMSAGFASFQFGGLPAALTLATSAVADIRDAFMGLAKAAMDAGFVTRRFLGSFVEFRSELNSTLATLGLAVQDAFAPVLEQLTDLIQEVDLNPIIGFIQLVAEFSSIFIQLMQDMLPTFNQWKVLTRLTNPLLGHIFVDMMDDTMDAIMRAAERANAASSGIVDIHQKGGMAGVGQLGRNIQKQVLDQSLRVMEQQLTVLKTIEKNTAKPAAANAAPAVLN